MSPEFIVVSISWGLVALMALLIFKLWPHVHVTTWGWAVVVFALAVFNSTRVWFGV